MIKIRFQIFLFSAVLILAACSKKSNPNPTPPQDKTPTITSLSVNQGAYNAVVTISGTGFSETIANDQVSFNGKQATVVAATPTQLRVTVPLSAGTGNVAVSVNNGATVTGPVFTYNFSYVVSIFAGDALGNTGSADGTGTASSFNEPFGITSDAAGNIFVADHHNEKIRKITPAGVVSTFATGNFIPWGIAVDNAGNIYCSNQSYGVINKITSTGVVSVFAGLSGVTPGASGPVNGVGSSATFYEPSGLATDANGNVYVADLLDNMIRKITPTGVVSTFAGKNQDITKEYPLADGPAGSATFRQPNDVTVDQAGNVYVADRDYCVIRKITPSGVVSTLAGSGKQANADGLGAAASFNLPGGVAVDATGNVFVADTYNNSIRKITPAGLVTTIATVGGGPAARLYAPIGLTLDAAGNIYVTSNNSNVMKLTFQ